MGDSGLFCVRVFDLLLFAGRYTIAGNRCVSGHTQGRYPLHSSNALEAKGLMINTLQSAPAAAPSQACVLPQPAPNNPLEPKTRSRREVAQDGSSTQAGAHRSSLRDQGNSELAAKYAKALEESTLPPWRAGDITDIALNSSFGQWRAQLRAALEDKDFFDMV